MNPVESVILNDELASGETDDNLNPPKGISIWSINRRIVFFKVKIRIGKRFTTILERNSRDDFSSMDDVIIKRVEAFIANGQSDAPGEGEELLVTRRLEIVLKKGTFHERVVNEIPIVGRIGS